MATDLENQVTQIAFEAVKNLNKDIVSKLIELDIVKSISSFHFNYFVNQEILEESIQEFIKTENHANS